MPHPPLAEPADLPPSLALCRTTRAQTIVDRVIDAILHEVARAVAAAVYRVPSGPVAHCQAAAACFGWLRPTGAYFLKPTDAGLKALADRRRQLMARAAR